MRKCERKRKRNISRQKKSSVYCDRASVKYRLKFNCKITYFPLEEFKEKFVVTVCDKLGVTSFPIKKGKKDVTKGFHAQMVIA